MERALQTLPSAPQSFQSSPGRFPRKARHGRLSWLPGKKRLNNTRSSYLFGILVLTLWNKYAWHSSLEWEEIAAMVLHCSQQNPSKISQRPLMDHLRCSNPDVISVLSTSCTRSSRAQKECKWGVLCSCLLSGPEYLLKSELAFVSCNKLGGYEHPHPQRVMQCLSLSDGYVGREPKGVFYTITFVTP